MRAGTDGQRGRGTSGMAPGYDRAAGAMAIRSIAPVRTARAVAPPVFPSKGRGATCGSKEPAGSTEEACTNVAARGEARACPAMANLLTSRARADGPVLTSRPAPIPHVCVLRTQTHTCSSYCGGVRQRLSRIARNRESPTVIARSEATTQSRKAARPAQAPGVCRYAPNTGRQLPVQDETLLLRALREAQREARDLTSPAAPPNCHADGETHAL
jgi:hypothetical protein